MVIISKQLTCQKYIYKIHSSRLKKSGWKLSLSIDEARRNDEVISLADSQVLRWIDELNGITNADDKAKELKKRIRDIKKEDNSLKNKRMIRSLYRELDELQFKSDYLCLIIDKIPDYYRACKGFYINGIKYVRLLGTNGGVKNSTIVFISERHSEEIRRRIDNGRNLEVPLVPAKLDAYKALTCSASTVVSMPKGILVVNDCETEFLSDIVYLTDENDGEPIMERIDNHPVRMNASDGFGLMLPSLAERWSKELGLDYIVSGANTRFSYEKGMVVTFDFIEFAREVAHTYIVTDAWGNDVDIRNVEIILTTSMVKLYDCYNSCEDYINNSLSNKYTFGITKVCPKELENERNLNYQFIQSYDLSDKDIDELIAPTMNEIKDVLGGDWKKTILFLKGSGLNEKNVLRLDDDFIKAMMIDNRIIDDPFVQNNIYQLIKNRIREAKVGALKVHGNYSIVCGDPYSLCQSMFKLPVTGLLSAGEIYNKYWADVKADRLACFRAPMTCHNNIRLVRPATGNEVSYWYRYMTTCTVFNSWDTAANALNGCDYDGDLVMLTDNKILVDNLIELPALMCAQRKATKKIVTEEDLIRSNIESFGNEIGQTTNWITSMFEVRAKYKSGSKEYNELSYRIQCGQLYQQNSIDKAKGIICKPMPRYWHDRYAANKLEDDAQKTICRNITADKKPYFMIYIYPALMKQYNTYIKNTNKKALREFNVTVDEMLDMPANMLNDSQLEFLRYYRQLMPVGDSDCVMNKICRRFEKEFDGYVARKSSSEVYDYTFLRNDAEYSRSQYNSIKNIYENYNRRLKNHMILSKYERIDDCISNAEINLINNEFEKECSLVCSDDNALCNILLDMCYLKKSTKRFVWNMCGKTIIHNLLAANNNIISYPALDDCGDIEYCGKRYSLKTRLIEEVR